MKSLTHRQKSAGDGSLSANNSTDAVGNGSSYNHQQSSSLSSSSIQHQLNSKKSSSNGGHATETELSSSGSSPDGQVVKKVKPLFRRTYSSAPPVTPTWVYVSIVVFAILTIVTIPVPFHPEPHKVPSLQHVFYYGWLTCMSTGLGALPFYLYPDIATFWIGISNGTYS